MRMISAAARLRNKTAVGIVVRGIFPVYLRNFKTPFISFMERIFKNPFSSNVYVIIYSSVCARNFGPIRPASDSNCALIDQSVNHVFLSYIYGEGVRR